MLQARSLQQTTPLQKLVTVSLVLTVLLALAPFLAEMAGPSFFGRTPEALRSAWTAPGLPAGRLGMTSCPW